MDFIKTLLIIAIATTLYYLLLQWPAETVSNQEVLEEVNQNIVINDSSDIGIYVYPYLLESGNGIMTLCSGMIHFQVYGMIEASLVWNNPLEGPFILYEYYIGAHATDYLEFKNYMTSGLEDLIKDFVIAWYSVN